MNDQKPSGQQRAMETTSSQTKKNAAKAAKLSREVQARLGQQLRALYDDVVSQGVPSRFTDLIDRLDSSDNKDKH